MLKIGFVDMVSRSGASSEVALESDFFVCLIEDILRFFKERVASFDRSETLEAMRLRDGAIAAFTNEDNWIKI